MADKDFNQQTRELWQPRTSRELTEEDAREMAENVFGFFRLLDEWDRAARQGQKLPLADEHKTQ
jgi:hypothetical protein